jgi:uncharacterized ferritin-like protein (DUF455 family)
MSFATIDAWARAYVESDDLALKFALEVPAEALESAPSVRLCAPGRPRSLRIATSAPKTPGPEALRDPARRAQVIHAFLHHELQAAELMAWAALAFADAPPAFRKGLAHVARDEIRHMRLYRDHLAVLGFSYGDFPVRDWFWQRVPSAPTAAHFVATLGVGFEGANLDHAARFAARFRAVGDEAGAALQERIAEEEIPHVRFAARWFERLHGELTFDAWRAHLPPPLSPILMRGDPLDATARERSGLSPSFVSELARWSPS